MNGETEEESTNVKGGTIPASFLKQSGILPLTQRPTTKNGYHSTIKATKSLSF
jgi:hypothetical protein